MVCEGREESLSQEGVESAKGKVLVSATLQREFPFPTAEHRGSSAACCFPHLSFFFFLLIIEPLIKRYTLPSMRMVRSTQSLLSLSLPN